MFAYKEIFGFEVSVDNASWMEIEEGVDDIRTHSTGRALVKLHTLCDGVEKITSLRQKQKNLNTYSHIETRVRSEPIINGKLTD